MHVPRRFEPFVISLLTGAVYTGLGRSESRLCHGEKRHTKMKRSPRFLDHFRTCVLVKVTAEVPETNVGRRPIGQRNKRSVTRQQLMEHV